MPCRDDLCVCVWGGGGGVMWCKPCWKGVCCCVLSLLIAITVITQYATDSASEPPTCITNSSMLSSCNPSSSQNLSSNRRWTCSSNFLHCADPTSSKPLYVKSLTADSVNILLFSASLETRPIQFTVVRW